MAQEKEKLVAWKHPLKSKTMWFGIATTVFGAISTILALMETQGLVDLKTGVGATIWGIITLILRNKTKVAVMFGIDDPTTPEDESGVKPSDGGFIRAKLLTLLAAMSALSILTASISGCGHLTPKQQESITASVDCMTFMLTAARECVPDCMAAPADKQKACAESCVVASLEKATPSCGVIYGDIHSPEMGVAIKDAVESGFAIYHAAVKK